MKATITYIQPTNQLGERSYVGPDHYELSLDFPETGTGADHNDELAAFIEYLRGIADKRERSIISGLQAVSIRVPITGVVCEARRVKGDF